MTTKANIAEEWVIRRSRLIDEPAVATLVEFLHGQAVNGLSWPLRRDAILFMLLLRTGLRLSEALSIKTLDCKKDYFNVKRLKRNPKRGWRCRCGRWNNYGVGECTDEKCKYTPTERQRKTEIDEFPIAKEINETLNMLWKARSDFKVNDNAIFGKVDRHNVWRRWKKVLKSLNLEHRPVHSTRHFFATRILRVTKDFAIAKKLLGHSSVRITEKYRDVALEEMKSALEKAF